MPAFTPTQSASVVFAETDGGGSPRAPDVGEVKTWALEFETWAQQFPANPGALQGVQAVSAADALAASESGNLIVAGHASTAFTVTLPSPTTSGLWYWIINVNAATVTLATPGGNIIAGTGGGATTFALVPGAMVALASDGTNWRVLTNSRPIGTAAHNLIALTAAGQLPAVDGSLLTGITPSTLYVRDEKTQGTAGGSVSATTWTARDLNTVVLNTISGASLATNQVTLPAGTYEFMAITPHTSTGARARLYNVSDAVAIKQSPNQWINGSSSAPAGYAILFGRFTLAATKTVRLDIWTSTTGAATAGLGYAMNNAGLGAEIYSELMITKVA